MPPAPQPRPKASSGTAPAVAGGAGSAAPVPHAQAPPGLGGDAALAATLAEQARAISAMAQGLAQSDPSSTLLEGLAPSAYAPRLQGARGAAALHSWRQLFHDKPETITARIRGNRTRAMAGLAASSETHATMRNYFSTEVPFGNARTAAYLLFGLADVADMMEGGRWREAEALVNLLLAAGEQAALSSWQWTLAWILTFAAEPPWNRIKVQPQEEIRGMSWLADPELRADAVGHLKDMATITEAQRRAAPTNGGVDGGGVGSRYRKAKDKAASDKPAEAGQQS